MAMDYSKDLAAIAKNLLNPPDSEFNIVRLSLDLRFPFSSNNQQESNVSESNEGEDDQVFSVLQGMISTAQEASYPKRRQPSSHDMLQVHTRSGRRVHSSNKRVKTDDEEKNTDSIPYMHSYEYNQLMNTSNLLSSKLPSEDEEDEDYDIMTARSPPDLHGLLQQYQSFDTADVTRAPSEAATERERESFREDEQSDRPKKKGRKANLGTEEEKRMRRLEQQRIAAARSRKNKKEELHKVERDNEELKYLNKVANDRIAALEKEVRDAKLHIYRLENEKLAVKGVNGQRHPAVKQLIEAVQALVQATDGDGYDVLDKVDQEEAALTDDENDSNESN